jgi:hypothetical protein
MTQPREPRNPFYFLLMLVCLVFVATCLVYVVVPWMEDKAVEAGHTPPPSAWREALRRDGWIWLLAEVGILTLVSVCAMGLDRLRSLRKERLGGTIPPSEKQEPSESPPDPLPSPPSRGRG